MSDLASPAAPRPLLAGLNYLFLLGVLLALAGVLTAAMVLQYGYGELPCPLCLLQRLAMFGVCFGIVASLRQGFSWRNTGISLVFSTFLLIVAVRQTLLDIYPRPGHEYIGTAVFGVHMPVWSVIIAVVLLVAFAFQVAVAGGAAARLAGVPARAFPTLHRAGLWLGGYVLLLGVVNLVSVVLQCGLGQCHTFGYQLLH